MSKSFVRPTLTAAVPGDLSLALPKRQLDDIIEMIYVLDKLAPGTANYDTLLYGAEVKFTPPGPSSSAWRCPPPFLSRLSRRLGPRRRRRSFSTIFRLRPSGARLTLPAHWGLLSKRY